jgi:hypothetical protein
MRRRWTDRDIEQELRAAAAPLGRMPTARELVAIGKRPLSIIVGRRGGGYAAWAKRLGLLQKDSAKARGNEITKETAHLLRALAFRVEAQSEKAPFDLLVNGRLRVEVKSATWSEHRAPGGQIARGHVFFLRHAEPRCDLFILCGVDASNAVLWRYFVPAREAHVQTLTITEHGKYDRFKNALYLVDELLAGEARAV